MHHRLKSIDDSDIWADVINIADVRKPTTGQND